MTPERILVVENLPFFRLSLQKILEGQGYEAVTMGIEREKIFSTLEGASTRLSILSGDVPLEWAS
ncbi:MAG: response regulator, partial [Flammeovirgaceae bacterium]|nr:response regulator [Flammeovirgaceae bacterium]MDW8286879.1 response regulator [Flammeovirgaceae bacterium]